MLEGPSLFRREYLRSRADRLDGTVMLTIPVTWQVIGFTMLICLIAAALFLSIASYSRVETATGEINPESGVAAVMPTRAGVVERVFVREGQNVVRGQVLLSVGVAESLRKGGTAPEAVRQSLSDQDQRLAAQQALAMQAATADVARLRARISGIELELPIIDQQLSDQQRLIANAKSDFENAVRVAAKGFVSKRDVDAREATVIARKQHLAQLQQLRASKRAEIEQTVREIQRATASAESEAANTQSARAQVAQQVTQTELAVGYAMSAPVSGTVTALTARTGQPVSSDDPLMLLVPTNSRPVVDLYIPTEAAGFISEGQKVRLAIDAFPYERFGTVNGVITSISRAARMRSTSNGPQAAYLVRVSLPKPYIVAFGRRHSLMAGMAVSARIIVEKRSLLEWLFEPIFAVTNR